MSEFETDFSDDGERVVSSQKDWNYYSHLSVYRFASLYTKGLRVVDAGCGTGYAASYLVRAGAKHVTGIDVSEKAISYCRAHFSEPATDFIVADLSIGISVPSGSVDVIFSSQAMEHLGDIENFPSEFRRVLKPGGLMVVAVPAIVSREQLEENIWNKFHLINLTPLGWYTKMRRNFARVHAFSHWPSKRFSDGTEPHTEDTTIRGADFDFAAAPISALNIQTKTLNTVLMAKRPRRRARPPHVDEFVPHAWGEGAIHAKVRREETGLLRWKLSQAAQTDAVSAEGAGS